jgi:phosphinothricin acetyltransferase
VLAIYASFVRDTAVSFETEVPAEADVAQRIERALERHAWLVAEDAGRVVAYACTGPFRARAAYAWTCEASLYVAASHRRRGLGRALYEALLGLARLQGHETALAIITLPNDASVRFHERLRFEPVGVFRGTGFKLGRRHDTGWWRLALNDRPETPPPPRTVQEALAMREGSALLARSGT